VTREEKLRQIALLEEKKRRQIAKNNSFKPHPGQLRVILSNSLERYLFCGNGFGKSTILVNEVHWAATGHNPITKSTSLVPAKILLVLDSPEKINDFITEYRRWNILESDQCHQKGKPNISFISYSCGSTITVITHQVEPLKLEGSQWTHIFFDEPPPRQVFTGVLRGGRIKGRPCKVLLAGTPITAAWLRYDIYEPWSQGKLPDTECFEGTSDENASNLDAGWFTRFFGKLDEKEAKIRREGHFHDLDGLALKHLFNYREHVIPFGAAGWSRDNPCVIIFDPHPSKGHNALLLGVNEVDQLFVLDSFHSKVIARLFAREVIDRGWFSDYRPIDIIYDSLGNSETTSGEGYRPFGEVINEVFRDLGQRARATTYDEKSDEDFIERIRDSLYIPPGGKPKLQIIEGNNGLIKDIERVEWMKDHQLKTNKPKLDIRERDFLSCLKYGLATNLHYSKPSKTKPHYVTKSLYSLPTLRMQYSTRMGLRPKRI
jgi:hypothetical protein